MERFFLDMDDLFETFVVNINAIPFDEFDMNDEYSTDPIFMINQNIINNAYLLRRSFELNNNRNTNVNTNINVNVNVNTLLSEALYDDTPTYDIFSSLFTNFNDFIEGQMRLQDELEDVKITISNKEFDRLNRVILDESVLKNNQCSICLEKMLLSDKLVILKCNHIYHNDCLKKWVTNNSSKCCVCRFDIRDELNE